MKLTELMDESRAPSPEDSKRMGDETRDAYTMLKDKGQDEICMMSSCMTLSTVSIIDVARCIKDTDDLEAFQQVKNRTLWMLEQVFDQSEQSMREKLGL